MVRACYIRVPDCCNWGSDSSKNRAADRLPAELFDEEPRRAEWVRLLARLSSHWEQFHERIGGPIGADFVTP